MGRRTMAAGCACTGWQPSCWRASPSKSTPWGAGGPQNLAATAGTGAENLCGRGPAAGLALGPAVLSSRPGRCCSVTGGGGASLPKLAYVERFFGFIRQAFPHK